MVVLLLFSLLRELLASMRQMVDTRGFTGLHGFACPSFIVFLPFAEKRPKP